MPITDPILLVSGASGHLGRRTLELLLEKVPPRRVRALSRDPGKLADFAARGVEVRQADFNQSATLPAALAGGDVLLLVSTDDVRPGVRGRQHATAIDAAKSAGVRHVIYTSMVEPKPENPAAVAIDHQETEDYLRASGLVWTALRNSLYADILLYPHGLAHGVPTGNIGTGPVAFVTREDCAAVAAGVLANAAHYANRALDVTGPAAIDGDELGAIVGAVLGQPFVVQKLPDAAYASALVSAGVPEAIASVYATFGRAAREGWLQSVSSVVAEVTGRPATPLRAFLETNRDAVRTAAGL